ncbi:unnamed protein product [Wickerhamomyces anomalus]
MSLPYTPLDQIPSIVSSLHESFHSHAKLDSIQYRLKQLRILYHAIHSNEDAICEAIKLDLNRPIQDTKFLEFDVFYSEILDIIANLESWSKPTPVDDVPKIISFASPKIERIPLGTVLIISPFNVPMLLALQPIVGALCGGNTMVLKQSEFVPNTALILSKILTRALDSDIFKVVNGAIDETTVLLEQKFDKILYTGSSQVGRIVAKAASKNLTPCLLELGGKTPVYVGASVEDSLEVVTKRIMFTKFINAGQVCLAADYLLVDEKIYDKFIKTLLKTVDEYFKGVDSKNFTHIIHERSWERLNSMIKSTKGQIIFGGKNSNRALKYIEPTIIKNVDFDDSTMKEEIFGPILPIIKISNIFETIDEIKSRHDTPLAVNIYSHDASEIHYLRTHIRSGALIINDGMMHVAIHSLPFGGIGESGYGAYHGIHSFKSFTHERAILEHPFWCDKFWTDKFIKIVDIENTWRGSKHLPQLPGKDVDFDANGEVIKKPIDEKVWKLGAVGVVVAGVVAYCYGLVL